MADGKVQFTAEDIENIRIAIERMNGKKEQAATVRDELRELAQQIEELADSFETGIEDIEEGLVLIQSGLDQLSQYV